MVIVAGNVSFRPGVFAVIENVLLDPSVVVDGTVSSEVAMRAGGASGFGT
jgi:hypothetical protein